MYFTESEFRCRCGCGLSEVNPLLIESLESLRVMVGKPIIVNSGIRCAKHNSAVGGAKASQHLLGNAADIHVDGITSYELANLASEIPAFGNGGIGRYANFVHVDVRGVMSRWYG